jgi:hypothetical protein
MISKTEIEKLRTIRQRYDEELHEAAAQAKVYRDKQDFRNLTTALKNQADRAAMIRAVDAVSFALGVSEEVRRP